MIIMKTKGVAFQDIWEKDGVAPYSSNYIGTDVLSYQLPIAAIGVYSNSPEPKYLSLLKITDITQKRGAKYDISITFRFLRKIEINSQDFDNEVTKISNKLCLILDDQKFGTILHKFGYKYDSKGSESKKGIDESRFSSRQIYPDRFLGNYFYDHRDWKDFEKKSAILFRILGFQVITKGHESPQKRVADFYCYTPPSIKEKRICIVVDCKDKHDYFVNASDERAMKEYIEDKKAILAQEGISSENLFFLFIAQNFANETKIKIIEISRQTQTYGAVITYKNLLFIVEKKLRTGFKFYLENFHHFFKNDEILPSTINYIYGGEDEF